MIRITLIFTAQTGFSRFNLLWQKFCLYDGIFMIRCFFNALVFLKEAILSMQIRVKVDDT